MTKKDFELVAAVIREYPRFNPNLNASRESFAHSFAEKFQAENPRFDTERFLKACEVGAYDKGPFG